MTLDFFGCAVKASEFSQHLAAMELLSAQVKALQSELAGLPALHLPPTSPSSFVGTAVLPAVQPHGCSIAHSRAQHALQSPPLVHFLVQRPPPFPTAVARALSLYPPRPRPGPLCLLQAGSCCRAASCQVGQGTGVDTSGRRCPAAGGVLPRPWPHVSGSHAARHMLCCAARRLQPHHTSALLFRPRFSRRSGFWCSAAR